MTPTATTTLSASVGVCGFGRCGSTMLMAMLDAGGIPPVVGSSDRGYEHPDVPTLADLDPADLDRRAVKLLDAVLYREPLSRVLPTADWRFVWLDRKPGEQARSHLKFVQGVLGLPPRRGAVTALRDSYDRDRPRALARLRDLGPVLELRYEHVLRDPLAAAHVLRDFLWPVHEGQFKIWPASQAVHRRDGRCRPDLAFELDGEVPA